MLTIILHRSFECDNLIKSLIHHVKLVTVNDGGNGVTQTVNLNRRIYKVTLHHGKFCEKCFFTQQNTQNT
jgi:hypothetical protein